MKELIDRYEYEIKQMRKRDFDPDSAAWYANQARKFTMQEVVRDLKNLSEPPHLKYMHAPSNLNQDHSL